MIVLSSSWKVSYEHYIKLKGTPEAEDCGYYEDMVYGKYLVNKFRKAGLKITDTTYRFEHNPWDRGTSITNYLKDRSSKCCRVDGWVVLDDETFRDYDKAEFEGHVVNNKLVLTNYECGISEKDVKKAIKILNK